MLDKSRMLREYPTDHTGGRVCVEVRYSKGERNARGYWLHIYPCQIQGPLRIIPLGKGGRLLLASATRLTKKGFEDAAWKAEGMLMRDDPAVRMQIAALGDIPGEVVNA